MGDAVPAYMLFPRVITWDPKVRRETPDGGINETNSQSLKGCRQGRAQVSWQGSTGCGTQGNSVAAATSRADLAMAPAVSRLLDTRQQPSAELGSLLGFREYKACREDGCTMEPSFSVPMPIREKPADTLTALLVEEPPGLCTQPSAM